MTHQAAISPTFVDRLFSLKPRAVVALATLLCLLPFYDKAFHMDDPLFLWTARQIQKHPADFYGFDVNWVGYAKPMSRENKNPPLTSYYIAAVAGFAGWSEPALHLAFLVPALAAMLGTYALAAELCAFPVLAALAALATPAFLVSSSGLMCDTMMLAFWVWAAYFWIRGSRREDFPCLALAAVLIVFAALTKYFGVSLIPLLSAYSLARRRGVGKEQLLFLLPLTAFFLYEWETRAMYGAGLLSQAMAFGVDPLLSAPRTFFFKELTGLSFTGGCLAAILFFAPFLWSRLAWLSAFALSLVIAAVLPFVKIPGDIYGDKEILASGLIQFALFVVAGAGMLLLAAQDFLRRTDADSLLLCLWVFGTFAFATHINWTLNGRSILPMAPAMGILLARRIEQRADGDAIKLFRRLALPFAASFILALLATYADYRHANGRRESAQVIVGEFQRNRTPLWFSGHWGFQYYMEAGGAKPIDAHRLSIQPDDMVVLPDYNFDDLSYLPVEGVKLHLIYEKPLFPWVAAMNLKLEAGFYSQYGRWPLPFAFGKVLPERYSIIRY